MKKNLIFYSHAPTTKGHYYTEQSSLVMREDFHTHVDIDRCYVSNDLDYHVLSDLCNSVQKMHNTTDLDLHTMVQYCLL